jgi:hypothetical protein
MDEYWELRLETIDKRLGQWTVNDTLWGILKSTVTWILLLIHEYRNKCQHMNELYDTRINNSY